MEQQNIAAAIGNMSLEEKQRLVTDIITKLPPGFMESILLRLPLRELPNSSKANIAFRMGVTLVGHAYRNNDGVLIWEIPQVPVPMRPLVYSLSRLIGECHTSITAMFNGRGDFNRAFELLNPLEVQKLIEKLRSELTSYSGELRQASGRNRRAASQTLAPAPEPQNEERPATAPAEEEASPKEAKPKRASRAKAKSEADAVSSESEKEPEQDAESAEPAIPEDQDTELSPDNFGLAEAASQGDADPGDEHGFGFDVSKLGSPDDSQDASGISPGPDEE